MGDHSYLILTAQTTWEHNKRERISYLKNCPKGIYPFSEGIYKNIKSVFFHGNKFRLGLNFMVIDNLIFLECGNFKALKS